MRLSDCTHRIRNTQPSRWIGLFLGLNLAFGMLNAHADILDLPGGQPTTTSIPMPVRGQTMDEVRQQFGEAQQATPPIGNPPITRWKYAEYSVVFEHQYVIHSVLHRDLPGTK